MPPYLIGQNNPDAAPEFVPSRGPGGVFANWLQGQTPKYAKNDGSGRSDFFRDTMARIAIRVTQADATLFRSSVADPHVRNQLLPRLAGNVAHSIGYMDFLLQGMSVAFREKLQLAETLGDNYVLYTFGQTAPSIQFQGVLINTAQDDQAQNFVRLYLELLRATQLARRQKAASIEVDSYIFTGAMTELNISLGAQIETVVPFSFSFIVKKIAFTNYTIGWAPGRVGTAFSSDPNAVPVDTRFAREQAAVAITLATPPQTDRVEALPTQVTTDATPESDGGDGSSAEDPRVQEGPPVSGGAAGPVGTPQTTHEGSRPIPAAVRDVPPSQRATQQTQVSTPPTGQAQAARPRRGTPPLLGPRVTPPPSSTPAPSTAGASSSAAQRPETHRHS